MLRLHSISYSNFLLFKNLKLNFGQGLTVFSGESGSGKSLFLEGIELLMGKRLEQQVFATLDSKAILEAQWIGVLEVKPIVELCQSLDIDLFDDELVIRREILPSGKNRCFINDSPVKAADLARFAGLMTEWVAQHHTAAIRDKAFQLDLIDSLAETNLVKLEFAAGLKSYNAKLKELRQLQKRKYEVEQQQDFLQFRYQELEEAQILNPHEEEELEADHAILANAAEIIAHANAIQFGFNGHEMSVENALSDMASRFKNLASLSAKFEEDLQRFQNVKLELDDLVSDLQRKTNALSIDEQRMQQMEERMRLFQDLKRKHQANTLQELMDMKQNLESQIFSSSELDTQILALQNEIESLKQQLQELGSLWHSIRTKSLDLFCSSLKSMLLNLEIPNATVHVVLTQLDFDEWTPNGPDAIQILFSANPGIEPAPLEKIASGGEMSRLMLCFKILGENANKLLVFDEIDTGVSGQVALKMGEMIAQISRNNQVFVITHLAQVASRSNHHFLIRKETINNESVSIIEPLNEAQKIQEVGRMLSGKEPGSKALDNARELIENLAPPS